MLYFPKILRLSAILLRHCSCIVIACCLRELVIVSHSISRINLLLFLLSLSILLSCLLHARVYLVRHLLVQMILFSPTGLNLLPTTMLRLMMFLILLSRLAFFICCCSILNNDNDIIINR